ncbi:MAG: hypothetical protein ACXVXB_12610 [Nocardioidaceae bacterium]
MTGEQAQAFEVRLRGSARPCTLWGAPRVRLLDTTGAVLPFRYLHHGLLTSRARPAPAVVRRGHPAVFLLAKYRCDVTRQPRYPSRARVTLPYVTGDYSAPMPARGAAITLCGRGDPPQDLGVSPVRDSYRQLAPGARPLARPSSAVSMRSPYLAPSTASYGYGDLNGDRRKDLVVVRTSGVVSARISGVGLRTIQLMRDTTLRLQALSDLGQGRRGYALVAGSALGCCGGYPLGQTGTTVVGFDHGRLRFVRNGRLPWDARFSVGHGDRFAGLACSPSGVTQVEVYLDGPARLQVIRTTYTLHGVRLHRESRTVATARGGVTAAMRESQTTCPGMDDRGWVSLAW